MPLDTGRERSPVAPPPIKVPRYAAALDFEALWREFPPADEYFATAYRRSTEEIRAIQNERFLRQMSRAWQVPFYKKHWGGAGMTPGDIRSLDDLDRIPPFSVRDLRASLDEQPFWAGYIGIDPNSRRPDAPDRANERWHHRITPTDDLHASRPRSDEHHDGTAAIHAGRTSVRSRAGLTVHGFD